jgi:hypothetical protein
MKRRGELVEAGQRFGRLRAVVFAGIDSGGNHRWEFECDCGRRVTWRASTVRSNLRRLGWCSCSYCYFAAGGWSGIADLADEKMRRTS